VLWLIVLLSLPRWVTAAEPAWEGTAIIIARPGVQLEALHDNDLSSKKGGAAKDLMFDVRKEEGDRLLIESRRQRGWISKNDAIRFNQAVAHFTQELVSSPRNSHALTARGIALLSGKEPERAAEDFDRAIAIDRDATLAYYHRATRLYSQAEYDKALADFDTVIELDPEFDWAYHVRGWIYYRRMDYEKALADFERAIQLVPTEAVFYRDRGNVALGRKNYDGALADYSKTIELNPSFSVPWLMRGRVWEMKAEYARALADYEKAVQLVGEAPDYHAALAMLLATCPDATFRNGKKALKAARKAYELAQRPNVMATLAAAHAELGEFDKAVEWQTKAIDASSGALKEQFQERLKLYQDKKPYRRE
jgi:tetratricopeptide (TPR) repeat protein